MTFRDVAREFVIAKRQKEDEFDRDTLQAYQIVRIYVMTRNKKRMPELKTLLSGALQSRAHTAAQQRAALAIISQQWGLKLVKATKRVNGQ